MGPDSCWDIENINVGNGPHYFKTLEILDGVDYNDYCQIETYNELAVIGSDIGLFISNNEGIDWSNNNNLKEITSKAISDIAIFPIENSFYIFVVIDNHLYVCKDGSGSVFKQASETFAFSIEALGGQLFVLNESSFLYTTDGEIFHTIPNISVHRNFKALCVENRTLLTDFENVNISNDNLITWNEYSIPDFTGDPSIVFLYQFDKYIYGISEASLILSEDLGSRWSTYKIPHDVGEVIYISDICFMNVKQGPGNYFGNSVENCQKYYSPYNEDFNSYIDTIKVIGMTANNIIAFCRSGDLTILKK